MTSRMRGGLVAAGLMMVMGHAFAQGWTGTYDAGLAALRAQKWAEARTSFKAALAYRPEDSATATTLPGPISERRQWRNGSPYSANFLASYAGFKAAQATTGDARTTLLDEVAREFEAALAKGQYANETFFFLNDIYQQQGATEKKLALQAKYQEVSSKLTWKLDKEGMTPEDIAAANPQATPTGPQPIGTTPTTTTPPTTNPTTTTLPTTGTSLPGSAIGRVPAVGTKFALIIGNSDSKIPNSQVNFGADDGQAIREALVSHAGYPEENVDLILNATKEQILAGAKALSDRMPAGSTLFLYFTGVGANLDGKDFLAGVDTEMVTDGNSMVAKMDLYKLFMAKEAKIFAFFQASRPVERGRYFGQEIPMYGRIAQVQATMQGGQVFANMKNGKPMGIYTEAFITALSEIRSNQIGITEFGWQVFYKLRGGSGGSSQTCTLPVLIQLGADAPF